MFINRAKQKAWSEEQEDELRRLFMENQESPQTDQDVIDWIVDNLVEKSRSRRGVIKKLKELGLIFKAPTKRSNAAAANKNLFIQEEDERLRELYDEHRLEADCLAEIMHVFNKKRSKKAVIKRMIQLGLIAEESEILPVRKRRDNKSRESEGNSNESSDDEGKRNTQELMQNLADLDSSEDEKKEPIQTTKQNLIESSDDDEVMRPMKTSKLSGKRDRNETDDETADENEMNATNNQTKRIRRIVDSSDEE